MIDLPRLSDTLLMLSVKPSVPTCPTPPPSPAHSNIMYLRTGMLLQNTSAVSADDSESLESKVVAKLRDVQPEAAPGIARRIIAEVEAVKDANPFKVALAAMTIGDHIRYSSELAYPAAGAIEALTAAMTAHGASADAQEQLCYALGGLAVPKKNKVRCNISLSVSITRVYSA